MTDTTKDILVNVVLDRSGSMNAIQKATIDGYNEFVNSLKTDKESTYSVTLLQFDSHVGAPTIQMSYQDMPLDQVPVLDTSTYQPRGMTPLHDAIGECIRRVESKGRGVLTVIITDGQENASREFTKDVVKALVTLKEAEGWKFIFLGADMDAMSVGTSLGVSVMGAAQYSTSHVGATFLAVGDSAKRYAEASRRVGMRGAVSMQSFSPQDRASMMGQKTAPPHMSSVSRPPAPPAPIHAPPQEPTKKTNWKEE